MNSLVALGFSAWDDFFLQMLNKEPLEIVCFLKSFDQRFLKHDNLYANLALNTLNHKTTSSLPFVIMITPK